MLMRFTDEHYIEHPTKKVKRMRKFFAYPWYTCQSLKDTQVTEVNGFDGNLSEKESEPAWSGKVYQTLSSAGYEGNSSEPGMGN